MKNGKKILPKELGIELYSKLREVIDATYPKKNKTHGNYAGYIEEALGGKDKITAKRIFDEFICKVSLKALPDSCLITKKTLEPLATLAGYTPDEIKDKFIDNLKEKPITAEEIIEKNKKQNISNFEQIKGIYISYYKHKDKDGEAYVYMLPCLIEGNGTGKITQYNSEKNDNNKYEEIALLEIKYLRNSEKDDGIKISSVRKDDKNELYEFVNEYLFFTDNKCMKGVFHTYFLERNDTQVYRKLIAGKIFYSYIGKIDETSLPDPKRIRLEDFKVDRVYEKVNTFFEDDSFIIIV